MTEEYFEELKKSITDFELTALGRDWVKKICLTEGRAWALHVPVSPRDPDMVFSELCNRLEGKQPKQLEFKLKVLWPETKVEKSIYYAHTIFNSYLFVTSYSGEKYWRLSIFDSYSKQENYVTNTKYQTSEEAIKAANEFYKTQIISSLSGNRNKEFPELL